MRARAGLAREYAAWIGGAVAAGVLVSGLVQAYFTYRETTRAIAREEALEANRAAARIDRFVAGVVADLDAVLNLVDSGHVRSAHDMGIELNRLLRSNPAVLAAAHFDARGRVESRVARFAPDALPTDEESLVATWSKDPASTEPYVGRVRFHKDSEPVATFAVRDPRGRAGAVAAEVSLKRVARAVSEFRVGKSGLVYVVDGRGNLIAHPDLNLVLARTNLAGLAHVGAAIAAGSETQPGRPRLIGSVDEKGRPIVSGATRLSVPGWILVTEQLEREAYAPVVDSLARSLLVLAAAAALGVLASVALARRVVRPIERLTEGARRIAGGDLGHRLNSDSPNELGNLATEFNRMADHVEAERCMLEAKVAERTAELEAAKDAAERANAAKTRFLAAASHDLRQPMHAIGLLVSLLRDRVRDPQQQNIVGKIIAATRAMEALFGSLLDISRLDAGAVNVKCRDFAVAEVLRLLELQFAEEARGKGLDFRVVPSSLRVRSDPTLLERILGNLVSNAVRYCPRGRVLVGCRRRGSSAEIQVWDTGPGIPPAHAQDIFDEFFQIANPGRDRSQGIGLGLSIVKRTADLLGHAIGMRSRVGVGSMFSVTVPIAASPNREARLPDFRSEAAAGLVGAFVVVIDDDADSRNATEAFFAGWGAHVVAADSAARAVEQLDKHLRAPDLIVTDYRLRDGRTGLEAIEDVRRAQDTDIPALIVTGDTSAAESGRLERQGYTVLHKPVGAADLYEAATRVSAGATLHEA